MDIIERLLEDALHHDDMATQCDCSPEDTVNHVHALNTREAAKEIGSLREYFKELKDHINKVWADTYPDAVPADTMLALKNRIKNLAEDRACWVFNARVLQNKLNSLEIK